jgi:hypothetical protein
MRASRTSARDELGGAAFAALKIAMAGPAVAVSLRLRPPLHDDADHPQHD